MHAKQLAVVGRPKLTKHNPITKPLMKHDPVTQKRTEQDPKPPTLMKQDLVRQELVKPEPPKPQEPSQELKLEPKQEIQPAEPKRALVVDVPMPTMEALVAQRSAEIQAAMRRAQEEQSLERSRGQVCPSQCTHVRANGLRCGRPAAPGIDECEWHFEWYSRLPSLTQMPYPEDGISIQHVLARTAAMVLNREITPAHARAVARLCREMRANLGRFDWEMARAEWVRS